MADIGLATAAATASQLKSVLGLIPEEKGRPKFGTQVNPEQESKCPYLEVFMACHGRMDKISVISDNTELRRGRFKANETALDARNAFANERGYQVTQEDIKDENGYILGEDMMKSPMSTLSNGCRLNLNFTYKHNIISGTTRKFVAKVGEEIKEGEEKISSACQTVADVATNTPRSWFQGWKSSSSTETSSSNDSD